MDKTGAPAVPPGVLTNLQQILTSAPAFKSVLTPKHPQLPCEWNKSAEKGTDPLLSEFLDCLKPESKPVRATNFKPNVGKTKK